MYQGWSSPVITIEPTTAIAEIALVSDISGVCSSRDTRVITPRPMNVASMKTYTIDVEVGAGRGGGCWLARRGLRGREQGCYRCHGVPPGRSAHSATRGRPGLA